MKRFAKAVARWGWLASGPIRRPIARKLSAKLVAAIDPVRDEVRIRTDHVLHGISLTRTEVGTYRNETNLLLEALVREVSRLQDEVEALRAEGEEGRVARSGLGVIASHEAAA